MQQALPTRAFLGGLGRSAAQLLPLSLSGSHTPPRSTRRWAGPSLPGRSSSGACRRSPATCLASLGGAHQGRAAHRRSAVARLPPLAPLAELVGGRSVGDEAGGRWWQRVDLLVAGAGGASAVVHPATARGGASAVVHPPPGRYATTRRPRRRFAASSRRIFSGRRRRSTPSLLSPDLLREASSPPRRARPRGLLPTSASWTLRPPPHLGELDRAATSSPPRRPRGIQGAREATASAGCRRGIACCWTSSYCCGLSPSLKARFCRWGCASLLETV
jgi:hypothetical protein